MFKPFSIFAATWITEALINAEGLEGGWVIFQCTHKLARKNDKYLCKDDCRNDGDKLVTVTYGQKVESGRITLVDSGQGSFTVNISRLQLSDTGKYWCGVSRPGLDTFTAVHLNVEKGAYLIPFPSPIHMLIYF